MNKEIEQRVLDEVIQIKEKYYGDPDMDSIMTDLDKGKLEAYRKVLDFFKEERDEAVAKVDKVFDKNGEETYPADIFDKDVEYKEEEK